MWILGFLCAVLLAGFPAASRAAEKKPKPLKIVGITTEITPSTVAIRGEKEEVTVQTREDFTEKVAVGSGVTAWYYRQERGDVLHWLEYPLENFFIPRNEFPPQLKKVIILPTSTVQDAEGLFDAIAKFMETRLGLYVAPRILAEEIRDRTLKSQSVLDTIDPSTGEVDISSYTQAQRGVIQKLASETRVDAVLQADIELVQVNFHSQVAVWDGVRQPVAGKAIRTLGFIAPILQNGHVPAATVVLKLWNPEGKLLWSYRRGFAVLALMVGVSGKFRERPISESLKDTESIRNWLEALFASFLSTDSDKSASAGKP
ncbi:MAG: hypothetical protein HYS33_06400 [Acidobacteria bacterium]|nr:hypothetical protein [Acidobacteriota bacterium]